MPRATQTEEYWRDEFALWEEDETVLQEYFIQQGRPLDTPTIVRKVMEWRAQGEKGAQASNGRYDPTATYEMGQKLVFPALDDEVGEVVGLREGRNERYGPFRVLQVRLGPQQEMREFAAELDPAEAERFPTGGEAPMSLDELLERFGSYVTEQVEVALSQSDNFVRFGSHWLPRLMLVNFHDGHCNIAEAMIDITGEPMSPSELLVEIPIEEAAGDEVKQFSLNIALSGDDRFSNVGTEDAPLWYLPRLG
jgi:hypothetical protein